MEDRDAPRGIYSGCGMQRHREREDGTVTKRRVFAVGVILCFAAAFFSGCARRGSEPGPMAELGQPAPDFTLPDLGGQQVSLSQFRGRIVMLDFWATWCGPCRMTMPVVESLQKEYADSMVVLAVNLQETQDIVNDYIRAHGIHSRVLLDEEGSVGLMYGAESIPLQILIDKQGVVRYAMPGYGPRMAAVLRAEINKLR